MEVANIGMVIGGRAARACDVCGNERARWYCAADEAYLCERCDGCVHTANTVAKRHERVRLGPNGAPLKIERSSSSSFSVKREAPTINPRKRPRSIRSKSRASSINEKLIDVKIKVEPYSPDGEVKVPDHNCLFESFFDCRDLQNDDLFPHQLVPIHMPLDQELPPFPCDEEEKPILCVNYRAISTNPNAISTNPNAIISPNCTHGETGLIEHNSEECLDFGNCIDFEHFLDSENDLEVDIINDCVINGNQDGKDGHIAASMDPHSMGMPQFHYNDASNGHANDGNGHQSHYNDASNGHNDGNVHANDSNHHAYDDDDDNHGAGYGGELCFGIGGGGGESPRSWLCKVKAESPPELDMSGLNVDTLLRKKLNYEDFYESQNKFKVGLNLNYEDVLNAWSDRGSLWMDGQRPDESSLDCLGGWLVPDMSYNKAGASTGEQAGQVPVFNCSRQGGDGGGGGGGGREARVMRYRAKRRTRLFSKTIRYEVRKLNAEKRPRMKGRFVKRTSAMV